MKSWTLDRSWTVFLDRDGVINRRIPGGYVDRPDAFVWLDGVLEAMRLLAGKVGPIVVVTNQQGVGKGLMSGRELERVHQHMRKEVDRAGGRLDGVFACPDLASLPGNCRKPAPHLAYRAKRAFPGIDFRRSLMVGDSPSDMAFGHRLGMRTALIETRTDLPVDWLDAPEAATIDLRFPSLLALCHHFFGENA